MKVLETHMKIATTVAIRATVATNISHKSDGDKRLSKKIQTILQKATDLANKKKTSGGEGQHANIS